MLDRLTRLQLTIFAIVTVLTVGAISIVLPARARRDGHRLLQRQREFRCGRRPLPERQRHLPRRDGRPGRVGRADQRRRRREHAAQQRHPGARERHRDGQERVGRRRAVHRPGAARRAGALDAAQRIDHRPGAHPDRPGHRRAADRGRQAGQQRRQQPAAGSAARNVQGVQRFRTGTGAADPVVAAAGRRGQRQLRADHAADRPGRARSWMRRSAAATTSSRWPTGWPGSPAKSPTPIPQLRSVLQTVPGATAEANTTFDRHPADLPGAGGQPGQLRPDRRHLPQVDRAGAGDLPGADGRAAHRRWRAARRRGRQAGLQGRPAGPAAVLDGLHPAAADPVARPTPPCANCRPTCTARQPRTIPPWCAVRATTRARSSPASGHRRFSCAAIPRATCRSAATRGAGRRCRTARRSERSDGDILPPNKFPYIPPQVDPDPGPPVVQLPPGVAPGPGPAPHAPFPLPVPPNDNGRRRRRGRTTRRRTRWCRRTAGLPPEAPPAPPADAPPAPPADGGRCPRRRRWPGAHRRRQGMAVDATYDQNGKFVDPAGGTGVFAPGADKLAPAENWVDLMLAPRQA